MDEQSKLVAVSQAAEQGELPVISNRQEHSGLGRRRDLAAAIAIRIDAEVAEMKDEQARISGARAPRAHKP